MKVEKLVGQMLPDVGLVATDGRLINPTRNKGLCVYFCYPYTGRPGQPDPPGWDNIHGAHGSTPQALGYSEAYDFYQKLGVKVYGVSFQDVFWQSEFVKRSALKVPLLSDHARKFARALALETFKAGTEEYLTRVTLIARDGTIVAMRSPAEAPALDGKETLALIENLAAP